MTEAMRLGWRRGESLTCFSIPLGVIRRCIQQANEDAPGDLAASNCPETKLNPEVKA